MTNQLLLATKRGFVLANQVGDEWQIAKHTLKDRSLTSIIAREGFILAGSQAGVFASADWGDTWQPSNEGLTEKHVRWLAFHPEISDCEFAGTEPAAILVSEDGGESWRECVEVAALREQHGWWLPYSSGAGCVRGFAIHGRRAYAAVEVGGVLRSDDGGQSWVLAPGSDGEPQFGRPLNDHVHPDVHSIAVHPGSADRVLAPTGGGFYGSDDGGQSWQILHDNCYVRAVWLDPEDAGHMVLGPSDGPSGTNGRIERTTDNGRNWQQLAGRWSANMVERFTQVGDQLLAVMSRGDLQIATIGQWAWSPVLAEAPGVNAATVMVDS